MGRWKCTNIVVYYILIICHLHFTSKPVNLNNIIFIKINFFHLFPSHRAVSYLQTCSSNIAKPSELLLFVFFIFNKCHWTYSVIFSTINSHLSIPRNKTSLVPVQSKHTSWLLTLSNKIEWYKVATKFELPILIANLNRQNIGWWGSPYQSSLLVLLFLAVWVANLYLLLPKEILHFIAYFHKAVP